MTDKKWIAASSLAAEFLTVDTKPGLFFASSEADRGPFWVLGNRCAVNLGMRHPFLLIDIASLHGRVSGLLLEGVDLLLPVDELQRGRDPVAGDVTLVEGELCLRCKDTGSELVDDVPLGMLEQSNGSGRSAFFAQWALAHTNRRGETVVLYERDEADRARMAAIGV
jgi:hypothetical protein